MYYVYKPKIKKEFQKKNLVYLYFNIRFEVKLSAVSKTVEAFPKVTDILGSTYCKSSDGTLHKVNNGFLNILTQNFLITGSGGTPLPSYVESGEDEEFPVREFDWKIVGKQRAKQEDNMVKYEIGLRGRWKKWYWTGEKYYNDKINVKGW